MTTTVNDRERVASVATGSWPGIFVKERITIQAPADVLFDFWRDADNLPSVMPFIHWIDRFGDRRSQWAVQGPAGSLIEWDAEITTEVPDELIAWRSMPGAVVASAGSVLFRPAGPCSTRLTLVLQFAPADGRVGAAMAHAFGRSPEVAIHRALESHKLTMESAGRASAISEMWTALAV